MNDYRYALEKIQQLAAFGCPSDRTTTASHARRIWRICEDALNDESRPEGRPPIAPGEADD